MRGSRIAIVGVGETAYMRATERSLMHMLIEASRAAIAEAGLQVNDVDGFINCGGGPSMDELAFNLGVNERGFTAANDVVAGASTVGGALIVAQLAIEAGLARHVLVPFGFKCSDPGGPYAFHQRESLKADLEMPVGFFGQPIYFAAMTQRYRHEFGLTEDELGSVAVAARAWAAFTPGAQRREPMTIADYRRSPMISTPLRVADCCLMTDGACAYVVTSSERARDLKQKPVAIGGVAIANRALPLSMILSQNGDLLDLPARDSAQKAYAMADVSADDIDVAQIYDCFSISTVLQAEMLGLCERGEGGRFFHAGHAAPGGKMPINTSGGHLSGGYLPGANLLVEGVRQLRGERGDAQVANAEVCAVTGLGANAHATAILTVGR